MSKRHRPLKLEAMEAFLFLARSVPKATLVDAALGKLPKDASRLLRDSHKFNGDKMLTRLRKRLATTRPDVRIVTWKVGKVAWVGVEACAGDDGMLSTRSE
jgi:hypothetical protein